MGEKKKTANNKTRKLHVRGKSEAQGLPDSLAWCIKNVWKTIQTPCTSPDPFRWYLRCCYKLDILKEFNSVWNEFALTLAETGASTPSSEEIPQEVKKKKRYRALNPQNFSRRQASAVWGGQNNSLKYRIELRFRQFESVWGERALIFIKTVCCNE